MNYRLSGKWVYFFGANKHLGKTYSMHFSSRRNAAVGIKRATEAQPADAAAAEGPARTLCLCVE